MALLVLNLQRRLCFHLTSEGILLHCHSVELTFLALPPPFLAQEAVFCVQMERKVKFQKVDFKEEKLSSLMLIIWLIQHHGKAGTLEPSAAYRRQPAGTSGRVGRPLVARENWYNSSTELSVPLTLVPLLPSLRKQALLLPSCHHLAASWGKSCQCWEREWRCQGANTSTISFQLRSAPAAAAEHN